MTTYTTFYRSTPDGIFTITLDVEERDEYSEESLNQLYNLLLELVLSMKKRNDEGGDTTMRTVAT